MIFITVAYAAPERQIEIPLSVEESCTLAIAIKRSGILQLFPDIKLGRAQTGIFGKRAALDDVVKDGDRIEIYRPLQIDPKQARLVRAKAMSSHGKRTKLERTQNGSILLQI